MASDSKPGTIRIDEVEYIRADTAKEFAGEVKIVILQRGWVMVGKLDKTTDPQLYQLHNAATIRIWGTTKGLGELATNGPTTKTVLDKNGGVVEFHPLTVIATIACDEAKWLSRL